MFSYSSKSELYPVHNRPSSFDLCVVPEWLTLWDVPEAVAILLASSFPRCTQTGFMPRIFASHQHEECEKIEERNSMLTCSHHGNWKAECSTSRAEVLECRIIYFWPASCISVKACLIWAGGSRVEYWLICDLCIHVFYMCSGSMYENPVFTLRVLRWAMWPVRINGNKAIKSIWQAYLFIKLVSDSVPVSLL